MQTAKLVLAFERVDLSQPKCMTKSRIYEI